MNIEIVEEYLEDLESCGMTDAAVDAFNLQRKANKLKAQASALEAEAKAKIEVIFDLTGEEKVASTIGSFTYNKGRKGSVSVTKLVKYLIKKGVDTDTLAAGQKSCTGKAGASYIKFNPGKVK